MKTILFSLAFAGILAAQDQPIPVLPDIPMPAGISVAGAFNQLGNPRVTVAVSAIYPIVGKVGIYGTTTADVYPKKAIDPTTGKSFYAISTSIRQGVHKDLLDTGKFSFLLGADLGPGFSQGQPSGIALSLSSSFVVTPVYRVSRIVNVIMPVRMLYISGIGWNPVAQAGITVNLKALPKASKP